MKYGHELVIRKKSNNLIYPHVSNPTVNVWSMLWPDCARFTNAYYRARIEGYGQDYLDLLFKSIVPSQLINGLSINDARKAGLVIIACLIF